jgi:hypothetical protein
MIKLFHAFNFISLAKSLSTIASTACFDKNPQSKQRGITLDLGKRIIIFSISILKVELITFFRSFFFGLDQQPFGSRLPFFCFFSAFGHHKNTLSHAVV